MPTSRDKDIAVLLLDAENLQLTADMEAFLQSRCSYQITCKIAFANWRVLGNTDQLLHERGYDLIQVPGAKDAADGKMIAFGCQLREFYRKAKAVFVCSSDAVMLSLCNCLLQQGLEVYRVVRHDNQVKVSKYPENGVAVFGQPTATVLVTTQTDDPNRAVIERQLVDIIQDVGADKKSIALSDLGQEYLKRNGEAITKALTRLKLVQHGVS
ncbi:MULTISPECIES: NYN domain-containing protein [Brasilonema]|uniref:NYN domain-containing protein n=1 Tax=Brasilonema TaxID=383614 RepID=UPI001B7D1A96|nr:MULTISPECIES: NYN domain-containing protein [Brasilonema]